MSKLINIAVIGLGQVGNYLLNELNTKKKDIELKTGKKISVVAVSARNINKKRKFKVNKKIFYKNPLEIFKKNKIDILFEAIGLSDGISKKVVETALKNKIHVITPNKALISKHGNDLAKLAEKNKVNLEFEAAVAGGIPAVKTLREGLAGNKITRVAGILNGTCNYILSTMETTGRDFETVLADAQRLGYAEAEPSFDVDGIDAAHKLTILAAIAFGHKPDFNAVSIQGIRDVSSVDFTYANQLGFRIKLVGVAEPGLMPRMQTCLLPLASQLAKVNGVLNAVEFHGEPVGSVLAVGPGAGGGATSSAVLSDLIDIAAGRGGLPFGQSINTLVDANAVENCAGPDKPFYLRLMVVDQPGVLATLTGILQKHSISVEGLLQQGRAPGNAVALVMTTHETSVANLGIALDEMEKLPIVKAKPVAMPIVLADKET